MPFATETVGAVSANNSSTTTLTANATFTGTADEVVGYATVSIFVNASHASATDGLRIEWSSDATNWDDADTYTIAALTGKALTFGVQARYLRVVYTNGGTTQTSFRLQTLLHATITKPSSHRLGDGVAAENDGELGLACLFARQGSTFHAIESSTRSNAGSTMRGLAVRTITPDSTTASGQAAVAGDNTILSSAASAIYVYAYALSPLSTANQLMRFLNGSTNEGWRIRTAGGGSTVGIQNVYSQLAVSPPAYLFRTAPGNPLVLNITSSGVNYSVAAWREG